MHLYLLRHGIAEDIHPGGDDAGRALTPEGRRKLRQVLETVRRARVDPGLILASPLKRARETAEVAQDVLRYKNKLLETKALVPNATPQTAWDEIRLHKSESSILAVGHNPLFAHLAAYLLGYENLRIDFKKGGILCVNLESFAMHPKGTLQWYLTPKLAGSNA